MGGRVYDPVLARFLSPDPFVQAPEYGQNYNRYSYAYNNPLKYTDPDGEFIHLIIGAIIGGYMNLMMNADNVDNIWDALGYFSIGATVGALSAGVGAGFSSAMAGGTFGAGFIGAQGVTYAASSFTTGAIIGGVAGSTHGTLTGIGNSLFRGDDFGTAFLNGLKLGTLQGATGSLLGGIFGGINAASSGRNFWDGSIRLTDADYEYLELLACADNKIVSIPESPGQVDWATLNKAEKTVHFYKWMRYELKYGDGIVNINDAFSNIGLDYGGISSGFSSGQIKLRFGKVHVLKTYFSVGIMTKPNGYIYPNLDFNHGTVVNRSLSNKPWTFMKTGNYSWGTENKDFNFLYKWFGYDN
jgi:hypothetical protein